MAAQPLTRSEVDVMNELILILEIACYLLMLLIAFVAIR